MTEDAAPPVEDALLQEIGRGRLWLFRGLALALLPLLLLLGEAALRLAAVGYDTAFWVEGPTPGVQVSNHRFAWRFFSPQLAREPVPSELPSADALRHRIFVLGGSAAQGVPEAGFGVAAQLQSMLERRHPEQRFEVINGAMTAVNSHVVRLIALQCARKEPDLFVVYMGNNEVVGPYGLASVFGRYSPRLSWLRWGMALRGSRWGQLLSSWRADPRGGDGWRGMEMFLQQQVTVDDPRLPGIYEHFERNLLDIIAAARRSGAQVVVSTVASQLEQPPFASKHGVELSPVDLDAWQQHVEAGLQGLATGHAAAAAEQLAAALALDDGYAALHYHQARALRQLARRPEAHQALVRARDLDTLRFRADSRINDTVRRVAADHAVPWVDAEALLSEQGLGVIPEAASRPSNPLFYEHVHFTFEGNHALAEALLPKVEEALGLPSTGLLSTGTPGTAGQGTDLDATARDLAFTPLDALSMERAMLGLVEGPPFVDLWQQEADLERRRRIIWQLRQRLDGDLWRAARESYGRRLAEHPDDLQARRRWAEHLDGRGESGEAVELWRQLSDRYPGGGAWHATLAASLSAAGRRDEALQAIRQVYRLAPERRAEIQINEAEILAQHGDLDGAERLLREAAQQRPEDPIPPYNLAQLELQRQDLRVAAEAFERLTERFPNFALGHYNLGVALSRLGQVDAAAESFSRALQLTPYDAASHNGFGLALESSGDTEEARRAYERALELDPGYTLAAFNLADLLLSEGSPDDLPRAVELYRQGLRRQPDNRAARQQLMVALERLDG